SCKRRHHNTGREKCRAALSFLGEGGVHPRCCTLKHGASCLHPISLARGLPPTASNKAIQRALDINAFVGDASTEKVEFLRKGDEVRPDPELIFQTFVPEPDRFDYENECFN